MTPRIDLATCTEARLWRFVGSHLESRGIKTVLVGGAVVAVYTDGAYRSGDLDFVLEREADDRITSAMAEIGFQLRGRHFAHPECEHLFVEFVPGPVGIGQDLSIVPRIERVGHLELKILSPTDCVRDRLASAIHFRARECLEQAVLVAQAHDVDWERIEAWCRAEDPSGAQVFANLRRRAGKP